MLNASISIKRVFNLALKCFRIEQKFHFSFVQTAMPSTWPNFLYFHVFNISASIKLRMENEMKWYFSWNCILKLDTQQCVTVCSLTLSHWKFHQNAINQNCTGKELNCIENVFINDWATRERVHPCKIDDKIMVTIPAEWTKLIFNTKNDPAHFFHLIFENSFMIFFILIKIIGMARHPSPSLRS